MKLGIMLLRCVFILTGIRGTKPNKPEKTGTKRNKAENREKPVQNEKTKNRNRPKLSETPPEASENSTDKETRGKL